MKLDELNMHVSGTDANVSRLHKLPYKQFTTVVIAYQNIANWISDF